MNISTIKGHLTQTNKVHINAIFERGLTMAKVNRISYSIKCIAYNTFQVYIAQNESNDYGKKELNYSSCIFIVK